jgi:lipoprotein-anchoring transpeptidase ErfK/SrfK
MQDAWLLLTASAPNAQQAVAYARKALEIRPESVRARRGLEWALARAKEIEAGDVPVKQNTTLSLAMDRKHTAASHPKRVSPGRIPIPQSKIHKGNWLYAIILIGAGCLMVGLMGLFAATSPVLASIVSNVSAPAPTQEKLWAPADIVKPTSTPVDGSSIALHLEDALESAPSDAPTLGPMDTPTLAENGVPTFPPEATETPGTLAMEIVDDNSMSPSVQPDEAQMQYLAEGNAERWIDVSLSEQRVYAYEGDVIVNSFLVSTGVAQTPTVTGNYKIYVKVRVQDMSGPGYYLRDVPYVMFFYEDYGLHGTYWHNNFGTPMSRGCVNLTIDDAAWLFNWAAVGTVVNVRY